MSLASFDFRTAGAIRFGRGVSGQAAAAIAGLGRRVMLVHGASADRAGWLMRDLAAAGAEVTPLACPGEPALDAVIAATAEARAAGAEVVVGLGGGAALDMAKAVAALVPAPGDPLDHLEVVGAGRPLDAAPLPFVAIPTTAGTGAEVTRNAVIGVPDRGRKVSLRDDRMLARLALVDPALADAAPRAVTLASGLDAVTQVIEPYLSCKANPLTDALCRDAIPRGLAALARLMQAEDPDARDAMALVSLTGGLALSNAGLGAVHGLAGPIGGATGAAHGAVCGALLPHVLAANRAALAARGGDNGRIDRVAGWIADATGRGPADFAGWCHAAGLPTLAALGVAPAAIPDLVAAARDASSMRGNPVPLTGSEIAAILDAALAV